MKKYIKKHLEDIIFCALVAVVLLLASGWLKFIIIDAPRIAEAVATKF